MLLSIAEGLKKDKGTDVIEPRASKDRVEVRNRKHGWRYQVFVDGEFLVGCDYRDDAEEIEQRIMTALDKTVDMCCVLASAKSEQLPTSFCRINPGGRITTGIRGIMKPDN